MPRRKHIYTLIWLQEARDDGERANEIEDAAHLEQGAVLLPCGLLALGLSGQAGVFCLSHFRYQRVLWQRKFLDK